MTTHAIDQPQTLTTPGWSTRRSLFAYATYCETIKLLRTPGFVIPSLLFPSLLFLMFGLPNLNSHVEGIGAGAYIMVSFGGYITMLIGLI
jgi:ABC-2 type transport system permease protein